MAKHAHEKRAAFLRAYGIARLPADPAIRARAAEMLTKQEQHSIANLWRKSPIDEDRDRAYRGLKSRARFCPSAICSGVSLLSSTVMFSFASSSPCFAASNHHL